MNNETLLRNLRNIPDFPIPGIQFKDVSTLYKDAECLKIMVDELYEKYKDKGITKVVGIESRGFVVGAALALRLGAGFVMCRKPGKLPGDTKKESYMKEYGEDTIEIHCDAITNDDTVLIHDDLLATGGTLLWLSWLCLLRNKPQPSFVAPTLWMAAISVPNSTPHLPQLVVTSPCQA